MAGNQNHYAALFDPEHKDFTATFTPRAWHLMNVQNVRMQLLRARFAPVEEGATLKERLLAAARKYPGREIIDNAIITSSAIGGEMRHDARDVMIGAKPQSQGLSVNVQNGAVGELKSNGEKPAVEARSRRGFG